MAHCDDDNDAAMIVLSCMEGRITIKYLHSKRTTALKWLSIRPVMLHHDALHYNSNSSLNRTVMEQLCLCVCVSVTFQEVRMPNDFSFS